MVCLPVCALPAECKALTVFITLWLFRYIRLIVNTASFLSVQSTPLPLSLAFNSHDVSVIIPTVDPSSATFFACLHSILACRPASVFIVTLKSKIKELQEYCEILDFQNIAVIGVRGLNKRRQMVAALQHVQTQITVFADDDVSWPTDYLGYLLADFNDPKVGATGTRQRVRRGVNPTFWTFLGICYVERRNFNTLATNNIDGSISTLSGRTAAYRTSILQNDAFYEAFLEDRFLGRRLNSDDDKALTRWTFSHGWKIRLQPSDQSVLLTSLHNDVKFLSQCVRWARAHWRGNFTVMNDNDYWYRKHLWGLYAIHIGQFQTPALLVDGIMVYFLTKSLAASSNTTFNSAMAAFGLWLVLTKTVKLIPHFIRHPSDIMFLPVALLFSYIHGFINLYALFTLHVTGWNGRNLDTNAEEDSDDV